MRSGLGRKVEESERFKGKKAQAKKKTEDRPAFGFQPNSHWLCRINQLLQVINYYKCVTFYN